MMQKEDLIKRMRLIAAVATTVFVVLVVALLVQFGFIAHYHAEMKKLQDRNTEMQAEIDGLEQDLEYIKEQYAQDKKITGWTPDVRHERTTQHTNP